MTRIVYSPYITALMTLLARSGVAVEIVNGKLSAGTYYRDDRRIELRGGLSARAALLTLAHEAGHHEGYERFPGPETPAGTRSPRRELEAYVYGWQALRAVQAPITRAEWRAECRQAEACARSIAAAPATTAQRRSAQARWCSSGSSGEGAA